MKIFIATDLHGSAYWTEKTVGKFVESGSDILVLLGDIYNHGPRNSFPQDYAPMRVAETLNKIAPKILAVRGNCDSEVDQMISDFEFLPQEVLLCGNRKLFFTHGHVYNKNSLPRLAGGDVMFYGHFHVSEIVRVQNVICINVGSCALPKDGKNCYCLADEKGARILDFEDNVVARTDF